MRCLPLLLALGAALVGAVLGRPTKLVVLVPMAGEFRADQQVNKIGRTMLGAIGLAVDEINNNATFLPTNKFEFTFGDDKCDVLKGLTTASDEAESGAVHAFIGSGCDDVCDKVGLLAFHYRMPVISWGCTTTTLSDNTRYGTLSRTVGPLTKVSTAIRRLMEFYGWSRIAILLSENRSWQNVGIRMKTDMEANGFRVSRFPTLFYEMQYDAMNEVVRDAASVARVLVICAYGGDVRQVMLNALDLGLLNGEYAFISIDLVEGATIGANTWMGEDGRDEDAKKAFTGLMNIHLHRPTSAEYREFEEKVRKRNAEAPFFQEMAPDEKVDVHAGMLYDAIMLYAHSLDAAMRMGYTEADGWEVSQQMFNRTFKGITGTVSIDASGDRNPDYSLQFFDGSLFVDFADYHFATDKFQMIEGIDVVFSGGGSTPPLDHPACGWDNELCADNNTVTMLVAIFVSVIGVIVIGSVIGVYFYRKMHFNNSMKENQWRVNYEDLVFLQDKNHKSKSSIHTASSLTGTQTQSESTMKTGHDEHLFTNVANYKGQRLAVKKINKKMITLDKNFLAEIKDVKEVAHENLNTFVGVCTEPPNICMLWAYCPRGSLQDVLENDSINLNEEFKISFTMDMASGMNYLHHSTHLHSHGRLKSSNCMVDNRWVCKVGDFGLGGLRLGQDDDVLDDYTTYKALLWTAPEILRSTKILVNGTKKGDVYSFGIILQEILTRGGPYCNVANKEPKEIVQLVQSGLTPPFRPMIAADACQPKMRKLYDLCLMENPEHRPEFAEIRKMLKDINGGKEINIMDNMLKMMEQYANNLEDLVNDRTQQLEEEKKKTDELLYQMLPRSVADNLKAGVTTPPESFDNATVYFSDIVGFTKLASQSNPMQVVDLLNDLYTTFDAIIDCHDVYKVETIGDAYMVVSGIPERIGDRHAGAIADMSLDILSSLVTFRVRHMPHKQLQLRIGIHTGPCVSGVVGLKMPRYCLFGDTVNTASRMESSSLALQIHMSEQTKQVLTLLGGYKIELRGEVEMKGKGKCTTYWLRGRNGFTKPLPDLSLAAGIDEHEFK